MAVRADLVAAALAFTVRHPDIWQAFCDYADLLIAAGHKRHSSDAIMHRIRWDLHLRKDPRARLLNNDHAAGLARIWLSQNPEHHGFFELRKDGAVYRPAGGQMELRRA